VSSSEAMSTIGAELTSAGTSAIAARPVAITLTEAVWLRGPTATNAELTTM
jgi:hypothetical protein